MLLFKLIILFLCFVLIILLMKVLPTAIIVLCHGVNNNMSSAYRLRSMEGIRFPCQWQ